MKRGKCEGSITVGSFSHGEKYDTGQGHLKN